MTGEETALAIIKEFESCKLQAYVLENETWATIGWGHAIPLAEKNKTISQGEADQLLANDFNFKINDLKLQLGHQDEFGQTIYEKLNPNQLGATLSFKYNCKPILFDNSTFLILLKQSNFQAAGQEFKRWIYGEGHIALPGLVRRRHCEDFVYYGGSIDDLVKQHWFQP
jgi:lysozyme